MNIQSTNPYTNQVLQTYPLHTASEVEEKIRQLHNAFNQWRTTSFAKRAQLLQSLAIQLRQQRAEFAQLIAHEMGKPISQGIAEIEKSALVLDYYAQNGEDFLRPQLIPTGPNQKNSVVFNPLGVILGIMPWNFPFWQFFRFAAPTLMAGNTILLKHASNVSGCALAIQQLFTQQNVPIVQTILYKGTESSQLIAHPLIAGVSLTGSTEAGRQVAMHAGLHLKKCVVELGGSDPYLILADADIDQALTAITNSRFQNAGQTCVAAKRIIVPAERLAEIEQKLIPLMQAQRLGDPLDPATTMGPLANRSFVQQVQQQIERSLQQGARLIYQQPLPSHLPLAGQNFFAPTLLSHVTESMCCFQEEIFGPVLVLIPASDQAEALRLANLTNYGLGAAVFSRNQDHAFALATNELQAGTVFVNDFVKSDPRLPFGGTKASGFGRELGQAGIYEFTNLKTVVVRQAEHDVSVS